MVYPGTHNKKEKTECPKKMLPKNTQHRAKRESQKDTRRRKIKVSSSKKNGKTKFVNTVT
jgi:hypothetical protein